MAASEFPQHERLTRALNIYRSAMRRQIASRWREKHGEAWFEELRSYLTEHQQAEIDNTRASLERQRLAGETALSRDEEDEFLLDISMFLEATKSRSDLFGRAMTGAEATDRMYAVYQIRNKWAHPPLRDLNRAEVNGAAEDCASILAMFNEGAADAVRDAVRESDEALALERIAERLEQIEYSVEARGMPTEQLSGMLNQLLAGAAQLAGRDGRDDGSDATAEMAAELRALRAEWETSRTRFGDWWRAREREVLALLDRLAGVSSR